jgi:hypothetical protein
MKKLLLIIVLFLPIYAFCQSPIVLQTYKNFYGTLVDEENDKWEYSEETYSNINFTFYKTYITADDKTNSIYRIYDALEDIKKPNKTIYSSKCLDEQNRKCIVSIINYNDKTNSKIYVLYKDVVYVYEIDN